MSYRRQRSIPLGGRYRQVSLYCCALCQILEWFNNFNRRYERFNWSFKTSFGGITCIAITPCSYENVVFIMWDVCVMILLCLSHLQLQYWPVFNGWWKSLIITLSNITRYIVLHTAQKSHVELRQDFELTKDMSCEYFVEMWFCYNET